MKRLTWTILVLFFVSLAACGGMGGDPPTDAGNNNNGTDVANNNGKGDVTDNNGGGTYDHTDRGKLGVWNAHVTATLTDQQQTMMGSVEFVIEHAKDSSKEVRCEANPSCTVLIESNAESQFFSDCVEWDPLTQDQKACTWYARLEHPDAVFVTRKLDLRRDEQEIDLTWSAEEGLWGIAVDGRYRSEEDGSVYPIQTKVNGDIVAINSSDAPPGFMGSQMFGNQFKGWFTNDGEPCESSCDFGTEGTVSPDLQTITYRSLNAGEEYTGTLTLVE